MFAYLQGAFSIWQIALHGRCHVRAYGIALDPLFEKYSKHVLAMPLMKEWMADAQNEPDDIDELEVEF